MNSYGGYFLCWMKNYFGYKGQTFFALKVHGNLWKVNVV